MLEKGDVIGNYKLIQFLGKGQFGEVWLAEKQLQLSTRKFQHALKFLSNLGDEINLKAAAAEIDTWIEANGHPNIMPVLDTLLYKEHIIIVTEFAESGSLKLWLQRNGGRAPSQEKALEMMTGILRGVEHLHSRNIVHRDLKPDNILLQGNFPRIADFGISRIILENSALTKPIGSPYYMSPESFLGSKSPQTDIWSAGVILYEMLTGTHPFDGVTIYALKDAIDQSPPQPMPESIPPQLQEVVYKALEKDRSDRYQTALEMSEALMNARMSVENEAKRKREWEIQQERLQAEADRARLQKQLEEAERLALEERQKREVEQKRREQLEQQHRDSENRHQERLADTQPAKTLKVDFETQIRQRETEEKRRQAREAKKNEKSAALRKIGVAAGVGFFSLALAAVLFLLWSRDNAVVANTNANTNANKDAEIVEFTKARVLADQALKEMTRGNLAKAKDLATDSLQMNKDLPLALAVSGWAKLVLGDKEEDYQSARADLERAVQLEPRNALFRARLMQVYQKLKQKDAANREASEVLSLLTSAENFLDYYARAIANDYSSKPDDAISDYTKAIELNPQFVLAYNNRGTIYSDKEDYDAAIQDYTKAIELNPQFVVAYNNRASAYNNKKDYNAAIRDSTKAIELNPQSFTAYNNRASAYKSKEDLDAAIRDYTKAIELAPQDFNVYVERGIIYNNKKDYNAALQDYTKAIELNPQYAPAYSNRGIIYGKRKDYNAAIREHNKAIELDPEYAPAYGNRGIIYNDKKDHDAAIRDYNKAIELNPEYADAYNNRAVAYSEKKDHEAAIRDYTKAIELNPMESLFYSNRAISYDALGRKALANADRKKHAELTKK